MGQQQQEVESRRIRRRPEFRRKSSVDSFGHYAFAPATARIDGEAIIENWWQRFITHLQNMAILAVGKREALRPCVVLLVLFVPHNEA